MVLWLHIKGIVNRCCLRAGLVMQRARSWALAVLAHIQWLGANRANSTCIEANGANMTCIYAKEANRAEPSWPQSRDQDI